MMLVDLCLCTFRRPMVEDTLRSIDALTMPDGMTVRVIVIDNDHSPTAEPIIDRVAAEMSVQVTYVHAPAGNISIARNAGLDAADGDWIAFLDDDEIVPKDWLLALFACQAEEGVDAVFGHSKAQYPADAPVWITTIDYHSQIREPRNGQVLTGHTCNAILRWAGAPWRGVRFDVARGTSGGEDTAYFFLLSRMGAQFAICNDADVHEAVPASRLTFAWLWRRKLRIGQSYVASADGGIEKAKLFILASCKTVYCHIRALLSAPNETRRNFWLLRGAMHLGVCAGSLKIPTAKLYGN